MIEDPIVKEVRETREAYLAEFNYDLHAVFLDLKAKEAASGRQCVSRSPKRINEPRRVRKIDDSPNIEDDMITDLVSETHESSR